MNTDGESAAELLPTSTKEPAAPALRVAFFLSELKVGGAEIQTLELVRGLRANGHDAQIVVHHKFVPNALPVSGDEPYLHFLDGFRMRNPLGWLRAWRLLRGIGPDVVIPVNTTPAIICALGKVFKGFRAKVFCTFHTTELRGGESFEFRLFRLAVRAIDCMIYVSNNQMKHWDVAGLRARKALVIHNGIDTDRFALVTKEQRGRAKVQLGIPQEAFVIGITAALRPEKNHGQLIEALSKLRERGVNARLLVVGDGPKWEAIARQVQRLGLGGEVLMVGRQHDVRSFIAAMDVGVLCSDSVETFSLAALEILSSGVPMVMSNIGGASEMVADDVNGYLFPVNDTDALVERLLRVFEQSNAADLGRRAAQDVRSRYTVFRMLEGYIEAFRAA